MIEEWGYPPIDYRISFLHRASARPKIRALIDKHPEHVVVAHGEIVRTDGEAFLRRAFSWLDVRNRSTVGRFAVGYQASDLNH